MEGPGRAGQEKVGPRRGRETGPGHARAGSNAAAVAGVIRLTIPVAVTEGEGTGGTAVFRPVRRCLQTHPVPARLDISLTFDGRRHRGRSHQ